MKNTNIRKCVVWHEITHKFDNVHKVVDLTGNEIYFITIKSKSNFYDSNGFPTKNIKYVYTSVTGVTCDVFSETNFAHSASKIIKLSDNLRLIAFESPYDLAIYNIDTMCGITKKEWLSTYDDNYEHAKKLFKSSAIYTFESGYRYITHSNAAIIIEREYQCEYRIFYMDTMKEVDITSLTDCWCDLELTDKYLISMDLKHMELYDIKDLKFYYRSKTPEVLLFSNGFILTADHNLLALIYENIVVMTELYDPNPIILMKKCSLAPINFWAVTVNHVVSEDINHVASEDINHVASDVVFIITCDDLNFMRYNQKGKLTGRIKLHKKEHYEIVSQNKIIENNSIVHIFR
jgi:hypothetical protein